MAIDTNTKKLSLFDLGCPWRRTLPTGDGSFSQGDKQHFIFLYSGIDASAQAIADLGAIQFAMEEQRFEFALPG